MRSVPAGDELAARRRADGLDVVVLQGDALCCQFVQGGRFDGRVVVADVVEALRVRVSVRFSVQDLLPPSSEVSHCSPLNAPQAIQPNQNAQKKKKSSSRHMIICLELYNLLFADRRDPVHETLSADPPGRL